MATVAQLIDRCYLEYLSLPTDQPAVTSLTAGYTAGGANMTLDISVLQFEDLNLITEGVLIEVDRELLRVTDFNESSGVATVLGARMGSTAADHASGAEVIIAPPTPRQAVFNALNDQIAGLYPSLWTLKSEYLVLDAATDLNDSYAVGAHQIIDPDDPTSPGISAGWAPSHGDFAGRPAVLVNARDRGRIAYVVWKRRFPPITAETNDLAAAAWAIDSRWDEILVIGTSARLLAGREFDRTTLDFLTQAIEAQGIPLGAITDVSTALFRYKEFLLERQHNALLDVHGIPVEFIEVI